MFLQYALPILSAIVPSFNPSVAQDAHGNKIVVWVSVEEETFLVQAATLFSGARATKPVTISHPERSLVGLPILAMNDAGQIAVVWNSFDAIAKRHCIEIATYSEMAGWSASKIISSEGENVVFKDHKLSIDKEGSIVVVWSSQSSGFSPEIRLATGEFTQSWTDPITLSE